MPYTVTVPGVLERVRYSAMATAAARPYRALRAVLIAVKGALRAAERVIFHDHAEVWPRGAAFIFGDEGGLQSCDAAGNLEVMRLQVSCKLCDGMGSPESRSQDRE